MAKCWQTISSIWVMTGLAQSKREVCLLAASQMPQEFRRSVYCVTMANQALSSIRGTLSRDY